MCRALWQGTIWTNVVTLLKRTWQVIAGSHFQLPGVLGNHILMEGATV